MGTEAELDALIAALAAEAPERTLRKGEVLVREGDPSDDAFRVQSGSLEIVRGPTQQRIAIVGAGETIGEIAMLAGGARTATARALETSVVRMIRRDRFEASVAGSEEHCALLADLARQRIDHLRLLALVEEVLAVDATTAAEIAASSRWSRLDPGATLFEAGDPSDAAYLVVSGRLAVLDGGEQLREVARGELVGEIGLIERVPRSATIVALRESTLARFDVDAFRRLTATHPALMLQVSRTILSRLGRPTAIADRARSVAVAVTTDLDGHLTASHLAAELARHGTTQHLWAARVDDMLGRPGLVESGLSAARPALSELLHDAETRHAYLLLETDRDATRWTRTALGLADRIVVVVSARPDDAERRRVAAILAAVPPASRVERWLALVHAADTTRPTGTAVLADELGFDRITHVHVGSSADLARVARLVSGNGTGLVLGGGGARGFAHIGVWRALDELGIEVDTIGGASIGAPLGVMMALQVGPDELVGITTDLFHGLLDYTVPVVSLLKGERIARNITATLGELDIRETWLPYFCVSTNLTRARVEVHDRRSAATAVRASVAIPGVLPPVPYDGDLLVDGGVLNNLPCDVMRSTGTVSRLVAVDLSPAVGPRAGDDYGLSVSGWQALRANVGGGRSRFPGIVAIIMRAMVAGSMRDRDQMLTDGTIDCYLDLELRGVQLLDFEKVAETAARGYAAARPRLVEWLERSGAPTRE